MIMEQETGEYFHTASNPADPDVQTKWMEGKWKAMHATAMDPKVNPLDGPLLPLSPALEYIQKRILPRIVRNPLARCRQRIFLPFWFNSLYQFFITILFHKFLVDNFSSSTNMTIRPFLRPVDAVKEGIFPDYYQVSVIYWGTLSSFI